MKAEINNITVGDKVIYSGSYGGWTRHDTRQIRNVARTTDKTIVIKFNRLDGDGGYEEKFWKKNGCQVGGNAQIWLPKDGEIKEITAKNKAVKASNAVKKLTDRMDYEKLNEIDIVKIEEFVKYFSDKEKNEKKES